MKEERRGIDLVGDDGVLTREMDHWEAVVDDIGSVTVSTGPIAMKES